MANQNRGVLYLQRDKFLLALDSRVDVLTYTFPPTLVSNLDILDSDSLKQNLSDFIKVNKINITNLVIVLSNAVIFEQDFKTSEETLIQEFLDNVPYETISIKKVPIPGGTKVLIGNATFYTLLADVFKQNGTILDFVIPEKALGTPISSFNASTARLILTRLEALSQYKFIIDASTEDKAEYKPPERKKVVIHKKNYTLLYSIPVFVILLIVLLFMILQPILFKQKVNTSALASTRRAVVPPTLVPTIISTTQAASSSASVLPKKINTVQIIFDPSSSQKADLLKTELTKQGILNIQEIPAPTQIATPIVLFQTNIDQLEKQKTSDALKNVIPNATVQDSSNQTIDLIITIGKTQ